MTRTIHVVPLNPHAPTWLPSLLLVQPCRWYLVVTCSWSWVTPIPTNSKHDLHSVQFSNQDERPFGSFSPLCRQLYQQPFLEQREPPEAHASHSLGKPAGSTHTLPLRGMLALLQACQDGVLSHGMLTICPLKQLAQEVRLTYSCQST